MASSLLDDLTRQRDLVAADRSSSLAATIAEAWEGDHTSAHTTVREAAANSAWWLLALARAEGTPSRSKYANAATRFATAAERSLDSNNPTMVASVYVAAVAEITGSGSGEEYVRGVLESLGYVSAVEAAQADQSYLDDASEWVIGRLSEIGEAISDNKIGYVLDIDPVHIDVDPSGSWGDATVAWLKDHPVATIVSAAALSSIGMLAYRRHNRDE